MLGGSARVMAGWARDERDGERDGWWTDGGRTSEGPRPNIARTDPRRPAREEGERRSWRVRPEGRRS